MLKYVLVLLSIMLLTLLSVFVWQWKRTEEIAPHLIRLDDKSDYYSINCATTCSLVYSPPGRPTRAAYIASAPRDVTKFVGKKINFEAHWNKTFTRAMCIKEPCKFLDHVPAIHLDRIDEIQAPNSTP